MFNDILMVRYAEVVHVRACGRAYIRRFLLYYLRPDMTEKLLTETLSLNTNKPTILGPSAPHRIGGNRELSRKLAI